jgi:hypothetical protein
METPQDVVEELAAAPHPAATAAASPPEAPESTASEEVQPQTPQASAPAEVPQRASTIAILSGYLALIPFVAAFYLFPYAYAGFPPPFKGKWIALTAVITVALAVPSLILGVLGHLRIRRKNLGGIGHVRFAYASCFMALSVIATALVMHPFRR